MKPHSQRCITKSDIDTAAVRAIFHCLIKTKHHGYQSSPCQAGPGGKFSVYIFIMCPLSPEPASSPHAGSSGLGAGPLRHPLARSARRWWPPPPAPLGRPRDPLRPRRCLHGHCSGGRQRSEAVTGPRLRVRRADRGGERRATTIGASRGSFRFFPRHRGGREEAGKNAAPREPPAGGPVTAARRALLPRALARSPSVGSAFESEVGLSVSV